VWQGFLNVSEFFSYKDSLSILATQGKKGWWYLMTNQLFLLFSSCLGLIRTLFWDRIQDLFESGYGLFSLGFLGQFCMCVSSTHKDRPIRVTFKNYLNICNLNFGSLWWLLLLNFLVLTCESDYCIFQFLNELNLTYQRLTGFVVSSYSFQ
jgi:hypothetical protein